MSPKGDDWRLLHAQEKPLSIIIVVEGPESVLPDVPAIHTIEMIPKSMILKLYGFFSIFISK